MGRPNIIYMHSHDTGRVISPYGHAVQTPNLDSFASQGILFNQAFTVNPTCSPSRASLVTGMWPHCNGMIGLCHRGARLNNPDRHWVHTFKAAGYRTVQVGLQHVIPSGQDKGFEVDLTNPPWDKKVEFPLANRDDTSSTEAAKFIKSKHDRPFFMECGFIRTHRTPPEREGVQWHNFERSPCGEPDRPPPLPLPDTTDTRRDWADLRESVRQLDRLMGAVIRAVDDAGLANNTLVIVTTDHGIAFPGMKCNLVDAGLGVMLMLRGPGGFWSSSSSPAAGDAMVTHMDLFPTACDVAGIAPPQWLQGHSLCPLMSGQVTKLRDEVFGQVNYHAAYEPQRSVRTMTHKYIKRYEVHPHPVLPNCDGSLTKRAMIESGWATQPQEQEYLFDLRTDPLETFNLACDPRHSGTLNDLRDKLSIWMRQTDDPLWTTGRVDPQSGMDFNSVHGS